LFLLVRFKAVAEAKFAYGGNEADRQNRPIADRVIHDHVKDIAKSLVAEVVWHAG